jgi:DNA-binding FrmR family transcriptional regulator
MREGVDVAPLVNRLRRIEGQARGIERMLAEGRECSEVVQQVAALRNAVDRLGFAVVQSNLRACLSEATLPAGAEGELEKALAALAGLRT